MSDKKVIEQVETIENVKKRPLKNLKNSTIIYNLFIRKFEDTSLTFNDVKDAYLAELDKTIKENELYKEWITEYPGMDSGKRVCHYKWKSAKRVKDAIKKLTQENVLDVTMALNTLRENSWSIKSEESKILSQQLTSAIMLLNDLSNF